MTGEQFSAVGDTVKLRNKKLKSVQELEIVIVELEKVVDKQRVDLEKTKGQNKKLKDLVGDENSAQQAHQLRREIEVLK